MVYYTNRQESPKKKEEGVRFLLIRHSKYSAILSKNTLLQGAFLYIYNLSHRLKYVIFQKGQLAIALDIIKLKHFPF